MNPKKPPRSRGMTAADEQKPARAEIAGQPPATPLPPRARKTGTFSGPILEATGLTKRYGGLVANSDINFIVNHGELRGIIGPNGAGKTTFFKMLTCEVPPTSGRIVFEGRDITGMSVTDVCQLGLTKSYQVNQLFTRLTRAREPDHLGAGGAARQVPARHVPPRRQSPRPGRAGRAHARARRSRPRVPTARSRRSPMARSGASRSGWRWRARRACCCSTSRSPA